ncbi:MAG TPA: RNA 2',3'-cyclic phosphodiesterase [Bryobacteraceae bacterium]|nr:RNA 2',3'-cyclic phosphodiesterase [Bryobacteraceae bacterium]
MRLFTGIALPDTTINTLSRLMDLLRPAAHVSWTRPYNLHVTLKFIGEWPEPRLAELTSALQSVRGGGRLRIRLAGIGWLPNPHSPRILFSGVEGGEQLSLLARDTDAALVPLGVPVEKREYRPHLTLARIRDSGTPLGALRQAIAALEPADFDSFEASGFSLFQSTTGPAGTIYTRISEFPLQAE